MDTKDIRTFDGALFSSSKDLENLLIEVPIEIMGSDNLQLAVKVGKNEEIYLTPEAGKVSRVRIEDTEKITPLAKSHDFYSFSYKDRVFLVRFLSQAPEC